MKIDTTITSDSKIEIIENGNDNVYQEIALLIDKPAYLHHLDIIRNEYPIYGGGDPVENDLSDIYLSLPQNDNGNIDLNKYTRLEILKTKLPQEYDNLLTFTKDSSTVLRIQAEAVLTCFEFGRPFYLVPIVLQSFFYDSVNASYLQSSHAMIHDYYYALSRLEEIQLPQVMIEVSPYTTEIAIKKALQESKIIFGTDPRFKYFGETPRYRKETKYYRTWYWDYLDCKSYKEVADRWGKKSELIYDEKEVYEGIETYLELLEL